MKRAVGLLLLSYIWFSCSTDENNGNNQSKMVDAEELRTMVTGGEWKITFFADSDVDDTADYEGYILIFNPDGTLGATNGSISLSGAWSITESENGDDGEVDVDFNIFFASPDSFEELADNWDILKYTSSKIELWDVDVDDGSTDYLTFEKI